METNVCGWFEIPVADMDRAIGFYEKVLGLKVERNKMETIDMAVFPHRPNGYGTGGALVYNPEFYRPSMEGSLVYLSSGSGVLKDDQKLVESLGGEVLIPPRQISPDHGSMMIVKDLEGNRVAIHSNE
ncbi:VOC family protein [bacterium]|nr:VOC family protein [bacterium]